MKARNKKETQLGLGETPAKPAPPAASAPAPVAHSPVPALVEYNHGAATWICKRFDMLSAELPGLDVATLTRLQAGLEIQDRQWLVCRRLFGCMPMVPPSGYPLEDMRVWSPEELAATLGIKGADMQQERQAIRGVWEAVRPKAVAEPVAVAPAPISGLFAEDDFLKKFDMSRIRFRDRDEADAFVKRVRDMEKLLEEKMTSGLARNLLMTEMQLRRLDEVLTFSDLQGEEWRKNMKMRGDLDSTYNDQLSKIDKLAPWAGVIRGKYSFKGTLSEVAEAYQHYYGSADSGLIDGIFTATEVQVLTRMSVQAPEPQYRAGWVVHALEAKANLWNPSHRSTIPHSVLKTLDAGFKAALAAAGRETGLVDLEKDGAAGEYPALLTARKKEEG